MTKQTDEIIFRIAKQFNRVFSDLKCFYVFGASIDGEIHDDEDLELVAIFETEDKAKREKIWPIIGKIESDEDVCIDLYPYTQESFEKDEEIYETVQSEGIYYDKMGIKK